MPDDNVVMFAPLTTEERATGLGNSASPKQPNIPNAQKVKKARDICGATVPEHDALDNYLTNVRGIPKPPHGWPAAIGYHAGLPLNFYSGPSKPALVMPKTIANGEVCGLHAVFLEPDGVSKAKVQAAKKSLGSGGVVLLRGEGETLLVCEGPEDAISLAIAVPDAAVICTVGAGTLRRVAEHLPDDIRRVVLVADNDQAGQTGAAKAAHALTEKGVAVAITTPPEGVKDANELLRTQGPHALAALIDAATAWQAMPAFALPHELLSYQMTAQGLYYSNESQKTWLAAPFELLAETRDIRNENWGIYIRLKDRDGVVHSRAIARQSLIGDPTAVCRLLANDGLAISSARKAQEQLAEYINLMPLNARAICVDRTGWHRNAYVTATRTFGESKGEPIILQGVTPADHQTSGTLQGWQQGVAALAVGNSRLAFALSAAFAGPLLYPINAESGGIHFRGASSIGKSSMLTVAASVWGCTVHNWRATDNAAEALARAANDSLLILDELGQGEAKAVNAMGYMLSNGAGKARMSKDTSARPITTWRLIYISTGEIGLAEKLAEAGQKARAGQEVRFLDIPADAGVGYGAFENLHGSADGDKFANRIRLSIEADKGHAAAAFLEKITSASIEQLATSVKAAVERWKAHYLPAGADGQVARAASRFALIAAAGELATTMGVLPWPEGEASRAAGKCFKAWIDARGGTGSAEVQAGLAQVRAFFEAHGMSRFQAIWEDGADERPIANRVGFRRRMDGGPWEYYVMPEGFKEIAKGLDAATLAKDLVAAGMLLPASDGKYQRSMRIPGHDVKRVYHFTSLGVTDGPNDE